MYFFIVIIPIKQLSKCINKKETVVQTKVLSSLFWFIKIQSRDFLKNKMRETYHISLLNFYSKHTEWCCIINNEPNDWILILKHAYQLLLVILVLGKYIIKGICQIFNQLVVLFIFISLCLLLFILQKLRENIIKIIWLFKVAKRFAALLPWPTVPCVCMPPVPLPWAQQRPPVASSLWPIHADCLKMKTMQKCVLIVLVQFLPIQALAQRFLVWLCLVAQFSHGFCRKHCQKKRNHWFLFGDNGNWSHLRKSAQNLTITFGWFCRGWIKVGVAAGWVFAASRHVLRLLLACKFKQWVPFYKYIHACFFFKITRVLALFQNRVTEK